MDATTRRSGLRSTAITAILTVLPFALAFAAIAVAVDRAATVEEGIRTAQNWRGLVLRLQLDQETAVRGYAATRNPQFLDPYWNVRVQVESAFTELRAAVVQLAPDAVPSVDDARVTHQRWLDSIARPIVRDPNSRTDYALEVRGKELVDRFRNDIAVIQRALDDAARRSDAFLRNLVYMIIGAGLVLGTGLLVFVVRTADRQRILADELQQTNSALKAAAGAKDSFLAGMSHELRTPLNAIIGFTGTLLMKLPGPLTDEQEQQLDIIRTSARHLLSLINDILDLSKIQSGKIEVHEELLDVRAIVEHVATTLRGLAEQKRLQLEVEASNGSLAAKTDRRILLQILTNLVSNAIKYTERGFVRIRLSARRDESREWIDVDVSDSGVGIPAEDQSRIFEAFERIPNAATRSVSGVGLGLYLSQRFAVLLDGRLRVKSVSGVGSTFTLSLPR